MRSTPSQYPGHPSDGTRLGERAAGKGKIEVLFASCLLCNVVRQCQLGTRYLGMDSGTCSGFDRETQVPTHSTHMSGTCTYALPLCFVIGPQFSLGFC